MKKSCSLVVALAWIVGVGQVAYAGPIRDAAEYVGETVKDTAQAIGSGVKDTVEAVTGNADPAATRAEVDQVAEGTLKTVLEKSPAAKTLFEKSYGYAAFDSRKSAFIITAGKGLGVAVRKDTGDRTYMHVATAGVNIGAGIQFYRGLFLFENKEAFDAFVNKGWQADAEAGATLGKASLEAQAKFTNGMAYYQLSDTGIMLDASLSGSKYWKSSELNELARQAK